ncbi:MAG: hypothetical protein ABIJ09_27560 [Pseudomonadota bacterium]
MTTFARSLPRVLLRVDLAQLLAPTYAREDDVSEELAHERMTELLKIPSLTDKIYSAVAAALDSAQGARTEDALLDAVARAVPRRCKDVQAAPRGPALSALTVLFNLELGLSPERLRASLESDRGQELVEQGFRALGQDLVRQLLR